MEFVAKPAALTVNAAKQYLGVGHTSLYKLIGEGKLDARKQGRRTVILTDSADRYLAALPTLHAREAA